MYNFRTRTQRKELLDETVDNGSDCEKQSDTDSEQDVSDASDSQIDYSEKEDEQDAVVNARASESRKWKASTDLNESSSKSHRRGHPSTKLYGKNTFAWETRSAERRSDRVTAEEVPYEASLADDAVNLYSLEDFWDLLFNQEIIEMIVDNTNVKIEEVCALLIAEDRAQTYHHHTNAIEIRAYLGVLYYAGLWKASHVDNNMFWDKKKTESASTAVSFLE